MLTDIIGSDLKDIMHKTDSVRSWIKGNKEVFTIMAGIVGAVIWMTHGLYDLERDLSKEISAVKEELIKIETILIIKGIAPLEMFANNDG